MKIDILDKALVARLPALVKAQTPDASGRRIVEVQVSTEEMDLDGDIVLQEALLGGANSFVATGHLDIDHKSELGHRMIPPIRDPSSYIVGRPLSVIAADGGSTFVRGEIDRARDGSFDPSRSHADALWASLMREPPVQWYASIYGFSTDLDDCARGQCGTVQAKRFVIKAVDWRSLAFTRTPKNTALSSPTRIVTAKAYIAELMKTVEGPPNTALLAVPDTMDDVYAAADCLGCRAQEEPSLLGYRRHFVKCLGYPPGAADIMAHALMHKCSMDKVAGALRRRVSA